MLDFVFIILSLVIVITIHEFAHAWTANYLGDPTAKLEGRISLNPLRHLDPLGTIMMFVARIGWGKPVPVNPSYFRHRYRDEALVALAGPIANLLLAIVVMIPLKYFGGYLLPSVEYFLEVLLYISLVLFAFNMLPFPPLDGSKFLQMIVPKRFRPAYETFLEKGTVYFLLFLLFDIFVIAKIAGFSILWLFIGNVYVVLKAIIFLGS